MNSTLVTASISGNLSFQLLSKIKKFVTTHLTIFASLIAFVTLLISVTHAQQHPFLSKEFIGTHQIMYAPWAQSFESTLADAVEAVSSAYRVNVWIDPSLARDQLVAISKDKDTLRDMLDTVAIACSGSVVLVDGIVMIVPKELADTVWAQYWRNRVSSSAALWSKPITTAFAWEHATPSSTIAERFSRKQSLDTKWITQIEHDLWPKQSFSKGTPLAIGTCLLTGMQRQLNLLTAPPAVENLNKLTDDEVRVDWTYQRDQIKRLGDSHCKQWKAAHPDAQVTSHEGSWKISAKPSEHLSLVDPLIPRLKYKLPSSDESRYHGELQGTLGNILASLSKQLNLEFTPWPLSDSLAKREIRVKYQDASIDDILADVAKAGRIKLTRQGKKWHIEALE